MLFHIFIWMKLFTLKQIKKENPPKLYHYHNEIGSFSKKSIRSEAILEKNNFNLVALVLRCGFLFTGIYRSIHVRLQLDMVNGRVGSGRVNQAEDKKLVILSELKNGLWSIGLWLGRVNPCFSHELLKKKKHIFAIWKVMQQII